MILIVSLRLLVKLLLTIIINSLANECNFDVLAPMFDPRIFPVTDQFNFKHVDCDEVAKIVRSMPANNSPGIDKILVRAMKDSLPVITSLINGSFSHGIFPRSWKLAEVSPILKHGNHEEPNNNRPISLSCLFFRKYVKGLC